MFQSRELGVVPPRPGGEPLLLIESERPKEPVFRMFHFFQSLGYWFGRLSRGERSHAGWGSIAFYRSSVHIERDPVRELGESGVQRFDLAYDDITRLEFIAPNTVIVGFGLVTRGLNQQIALSLTLLEAQDKFESIVEHIEQRNTGHLYSVLNDGNLTHSREWTWEERFPGFGLIDEATVELVEAGPTWHWKIVIGDDEEFDAVESHGLVLTESSAPDRGLMQIFSSQVVDGSGFGLSLVERSGSNFGIRTSGDERFWIDADGDVRLGEEIVGTYPVDPFPTGGPDALTVVFGSAPRVVTGPLVSKCLSLMRPLPKAWVLALALLTLLPRHGHETDPRNR